MSFPDFPPLLLASKSPRRKFLLEMAGFQFRQISPEVAEVWPQNMPLGQIPEYLAGLKANALLTRRRHNEVVVAADSVVILDEELIGKPVSTRDATHILQRLSGRVHSVITGVCMISGQGKWFESEKADVKMAELTDEEISYYVETFKPLDKAGAYGIQEWIGLCRVEKIEGTFSNIMGLPMYLIYEMLSEIANRSTP